MVVKKEGQKGEPSVFAGVNFVYAVAKVSFVGINQDLSSRGYHHYRATAMQSLIFYLLNLLLLATSLGD